MRREYPNSLKSSLIIDLGHGDDWIRSPLAGLLNIRFSTEGFGHPDEGKIPNRHRTVAAHHIVVDRQEPQDTASCNHQKEEEGIGLEVGDTAGAGRQEEGGTADAALQRGFHSWAGVGSRSCALRVVPEAVPGCASRTADRKVIAQGEGEGTTGCATRLPRRAAEDTGCYAGSGVGWEEESGKARTPWAHPSQEGCRWVLDRCSCRCFPSWSNRSSGLAVYASSVSLKKIPFLCSARKEPTYVAVLPMLATEHASHASHDSTSQSTLLVRLTAGLSTVVVLGCLGLVAVRREQAGRELAHELAGRVLATVTAVSAVTAAAEELTGESAERVRTVAAATTVSGVLAAKEGVHCHALWFLLAFASPKRPHQTHNPTTQHREG